MGLSTADIQALMASGRPRNQYGPKLVEFMESDDVAINPQEAWPFEFANKTVLTLSAGFKKAAKDANIEDSVIIRVKDDALFILHKERARVLLEKAAANE